MCLACYNFSATNIFVNLLLQEEVEEIFDVRDPQNKTPKMRQEERLKIEAEKFDEDHYM